MLNKRYSALVALALMSSMAVAQLMVLKSNEESGHLHHNDYSYIEAIEHFESLKEKNTEVKRKLAECYRLTGNTEKAEQYYKDVVGTEDSQSEDVYHYAEMLKSNGKYKEAILWMKKYADASKNDKRAHRHLEDETYHNKLLKDHQDRYRITNLEVNTENSDFGPAFYKDKIAFTSSRQGVKFINRTYNWNGKPFLDLFAANRNMDTGELSEPVHIQKNLNTKYHEGPATFTTSGNRMYFTRNNYHKGKSGVSEGGVNHLMIFLTNFENGKWQPEIKLSINNDNYSVGHPCLSSDETVVYFASDMPGGKGGTDIYYAAVKPDGTLGDPINVGDPINTEGNEMFPFIHEDGTLFFSSNGHAGLGGLDIFMAPSKSGKFNRIVNMGYPLNDRKDDFGLIIDNDFKHGYFSSNRKGGQGDDDIYAFELLKPFVFKIIIKGIARDQQTAEPIAASIVTLFDSKGNSLESVLTDSTGAYEFEVDPDKEFILKGKKEKYFDGSNTTSTENLKEDFVLVDVELEKNPALSLYCLVLDKANQKPLEGVLITLVDNNTGSSEDFITPLSGDFRKLLINNKINDSISYNLTIEKEGFLAKKVTYNKLLDREGEYSMHDELDISLNKIDVGADLAKIIDINPIYFDLGKHHIRNDAAIELDKIVQVMNENPHMEVELGSHTDCRGSASSNARLSDKRAKSSADYIKKRIQNSSRIYGKGYGETKLVNHCECEGNKKITCTDQEHQANRRTEFKIIKM